MRVAYKIFDLGPKTLFHGVYGSRKLPVGRWIKAEKKMVTDGSRATPYLSGFHSYDTLEDIRRWLEGATNYENRIIVKVRIKRWRFKPRAIRKTRLSDWLLILPIDWKNRIPVTEFMASNV